MLANKKDTDQVTDVFTQEETTSENSDAATREQADIFVAKLMEIKREDGTPKYETLEDALEALKHSQTFIPQLQQENAELRKKAEEAKTLKETLERLKQGNNVNEEKPGEQTNTNGGLSEEAAARLIEQKLKEKEQETVLVSNIKSVQDRLIQKYGDKQKAQEQVVIKAKELGMSPDALKQLAASAPNAVLAFFGEAVKPTGSNNISTTRIPYSPPNEELEAPKKSLLSGSGATTRNQVDYVKRIKENVYKRMGVEN